MTRRAVWLLALCGACATTPHTQVLVEYTRPEPIEQVTVDAVNATAHDLPMPRASIVEQAVRLVTQQRAPEPTIADAFGRAATARLAELRVRTVETGALRLRIRLTAWDVRGGDAAGAVVFVSADYELLGGHGEVLWHVRQDRLPVRLSGPNLSRYEVGRVAAACIEAAVASWPAAASVSPR